MTLQEMIDNNKNETKPQTSSIQRMIDNNKKTAEQKQERLTLAEIINASRKETTA